MAYLKLSYDLPRVPPAPATEAPPDRFETFLEVLRRGLARKHELWAAGAACRPTHDGGLGVDPDTFFPGRGESAKMVEAKAVCSTCPVTAECLDYGQSQEYADQPLGVWGGTSARQRRQLAAEARIIRKSLRGREKS